LVLLHVVCHTGSRIALGVAWAVTTVTLLFAVLGLLTIGVAILPLGGLLAWACSATPRPGTAAV
jgi:hypothetical protein